MDERLVKSIIALEMKAFVDSTQDGYASLEFSGFYKSWIQSRDSAPDYNYHWDRMVQIAAANGYQTHD